MAVLFTWLAAACGSVWLLQHKHSRRMRRPRILTCGVGSRQWRGHQEACGVELQWEVERSSLEVFWTLRHRTERPRYVLRRSFIICTCCARASGFCYARHLPLKSSNPVLARKNSVHSVCRDRAVTVLQVCLKDTGTLDVSDVASGAIDSLEFSEPVEAFALGHGRLLVATGSQVSSTLSPPSVCQSQRLVSQPKRNVKRHPKICQSPFCLKKALCTHWTLCYGTATNQSRVCCCQAK